MAQAESSDKTELIGMEEKSSIPDPENPKTTYGSNQPTSTNDEFDFDVWCNHYKLNDATKTLLEENGYNLEVALLTLDKDKLDKLKEKGLAKGQKRILSFAVKKLRADQSSGSSNLQQLQAEDNANNQKDQQGDAISETGVQTSLATSNVNLLRVVIFDYATGDGLYWFLVFAIIMSLVLQSIVAVLSRHKASLKEEGRLVKVVKLSRISAVFSAILALLTLIIFGFSVEVSKRVKDGSE